MRVREHDGRIEVVDSPGIHWLLALLFVGVGALFFVGPIFLFKDADRMRWWLRALVSMVGGLGVLVGAWVLKNAPRSRAILDRARATLVVDRWGVDGHRRREWPLQALAAVQVVEKRDDESNRIYQVHLVLHDDRPVPVSMLWLHDRAAIERAAKRMAELAGVLVVNANAREPAP